MSLAKVVFFLIMWVGATLVLLPVVVMGTLYVEWLTSHMTTTVCAIALAFGLLAAIYSVLESL